MMTIPILGYEQVYDEHFYGCYGCDPDVNKYMTTIPKLAMRIGAISCVVDGA
jgi:hypothetical protein